MSDIDNLTKAISNINVNDYDDRILENNERLDITQAKPPKFINFDQKSKDDWKTRVYKYSLQKRQEAQNSANNEQTRKKKFEKNALYTLYLINKLEPLTKTNTSLSNLNFNNAQFPTIYNEQVYLKNFFDDVFANRSMTIYILSKLAPEPPPLNQFYWREKKWVETVKENIYTIKEIVDDKKSTDYASFVITFLEKIHIDVNLLQSIEYVEKALETKINMTCKPFNFEKMKECLKRLENKETLTIFEDIIQDSRSYTKYKTKANEKFSKVFELYGYIFDKNLFSAYFNNINDESWQLVLKSFPDVSERIKLSQIKTREVPYEYQIQDSDQAYANFLSNSFFDKMNLCQFRHIPWKRNMEIKNMQDAFYFDQSENIVTLIKEKGKIENLEDIESLFWGKITTFTNSHSIEFLQKIWIYKMKSFFKTTDVIKFLSNFFKKNTSTRKPDTNAMKKIIYYDFYVPNATDKQ